MMMTDKTRHLIETVIARRERDGLNVRATVLGRTSKLSFRTSARRDDFMRRVKVNGGACEVLKC